MNIILVLCLVVLLFKQGYSLVLRTTASTNEHHDVTKECDGKETGYYAHPMKCSLYLSCDGKGNGSVKACKPHNNFHPEYKVCVWEQIYHCSGIIKSNQTTRIISYCRRQKLEGVYEDPQHCDSYVICSIEGAYHMKCPSALLFNSVTNKCDKAANVHCNVNSSKESVKRINKLCEGKRPGNYQDPHHCNVYIVCNGVSATQMKCPEGLWYDQILNICELPAKVLCKRSHIHPITRIITTSPSSLDSTGSKRSTTKTADSADRRSATTNTPVSSSRRGTDEIKQDSLDKSKTTITYTLTEVIKPTFTCKGRKPGKYAMNDACQYFYLCTDKEDAILKKCPKHKNFQPVYRNCVWTYVYACDDPEFCNGKSDGKYKNKNNCYGYFQCSGERTFPRNCDPGLRFNGNQCVDAAQYICPKSPIMLNVVQ